jgi:hypothetical protein
MPLPYSWKVRRENVTDHHGLPRAAGRDLPGKFGDAAGWRPNPGADPAANVAYDLKGHRLA